MQGSAAQLVLALVCQRGKVFADTVEKLEKQLNFIFFKMGLKETKLAQFGRCIRCSKLLHCSKKPSQVRDILARTQHLPLLPMIGGTEASPMTMAMG